MFEYWGLRWKLSRLERATRAAGKGTDEAVEAARRRGASSIEVDEIAGGSDEGMLQRRIHEALSEYLIAKAHRLVIPLPEWTNSNFWSVNIDTDEHVLTRAGINELRSAIRAEEKARQERVLAWVPAIIGILGAMIGLAAILVGKDK